ncbi:hypothetical protein B484DRAFT_388979 [Ochromonadaceae sp. CCMP2298]|nr:hypothetical protein B484DRAFT_388979 [Ochromonadaceae sp. CCMP2298]
MAGTEWFQKGDPRLRGPYHQKIPRVESRLVWNNVVQGLRPPVGTTYDEWLRCENFFKNQLGDLAECRQAPNTQWSPRRHHAGVHFKGFLWVLGGRAREFVYLPEERAIGGIVGPKVENIPDVPANKQQRFSTQREAVVVKSDVWKSADGIKWTLVTPGCKAPEPKLVAQGYPGQGKYGIKEFACSSDTDCYGDERCDETLNTCVCRMWSPREQHAVAAHGAYMYVSGGYASALYSQFSNCGEYACGDVDASSYRYFLSDVWRSSDGMIWTLVKEDAFAVQDPRFQTLVGRGGHQMLALEDRGGDPYLWVVGGRGGDSTQNGSPEVYFNDIWTSPIGAGGPTVWTVHKHGPGGESMPWAPRTGHAVALETATPANKGVRTLFVYGGYNNGTFLDDLWAWRLDFPKEDWREDFTAEALFSTGVGQDFVYANSSPSAFYVTPDSPLNMLQRFWVPTDPDDTFGLPLEQRTYLSEDKVQVMNSVGLYTIRDLADVGLYTLLKLRGFDYPSVPQEERLQLYDVCDYRALAIALVNKCQLNVPSLFDGQRNMPWNIVPEFGAGPPQSGPSAAWHGRDNYDFLLGEADDPTTLVENWDGCTYNILIEGLFGPNVDGLGFVDQVQSVRDPEKELQELFCRQTPGPRAYHNMVVFEERLYLLGGKQSEKRFYADAWYRDAKLPKARFDGKPGSRDTNPWFYFVADKAGSSFEYRVWDPNIFKEIREWTPVTGKTDVGWLDWRMGGPGNGRYQLYVRAVDPAGNRDARFIMGENVYNWYYLSPTPWDIILGTIFGFLFLCFLAYLEYRRRVKKAAMERYAMKRMRRKFKAMQRDINGRAVDWRTLYMESKQNDDAGVKDKKKKKKSRDKNAERREKERKKREKDKELIKKKLAASKEHKEKVKVQKDKEATQEMVPLKKMGGKKSRVAPTEGKEEDDDSDPGLEGMLLRDEESKAGGPARPQKTKPSGKTSKMAGGAESKMEGGAQDLEEKADEPSSRLAPVPKSNKPKGDKVVPGVSMRGESKEPGQLPASKDTEGGTKQRRVNKKLSEYEAKDDGPPPGNPKKNT